MSTKANSRWYDEVKELTEQLVRINSVSPSVAGENACAAEITRALEERGLTPGYWKTSGDERKNGKTRTRTTNSSWMRAARSGCLAAAVST
jgi:acetylornithine deacetylase/succinyl-diaminopimelate desuccinylase-like protein